MAARRIRGGVTPKTVMSPTRVQMASRAAGLALAVLVCWVTHSPFVAAATRDPSVTGVPAAVVTEDAPWDAALLVDNLSDVDLSTEFVETQAEAEVSTLACNCCRLRLGSLKQEKWGYRVEVNLILSCARLYSLYVMLMMLLLLLCSRVPTFRCPGVLR